MARVAFITRGHGFGHAARDLLVVEAMRRADPGLDLHLAASGTGAEYYRRRGVAFTDLGIPDERDTGEAAGRAVFAHLTGLPRPDLVVVDEVMWALPICRRVLRTPCVLLTDWFYGEIGLPALDRTMNQATEIVVTDFPDAHPLPPDITVPVTFSGPIVAPLDLPRADARAALGLDAAAFTGVLTLGGMPDRPDARAIADLVAAAWRAHAAPGDRLVVLADGDGDDRVTYAGVSDEPERWFRAADVVLADAAGFTVCELTRHGVPTVAVRTGRLSAGVHARLGVLERAGLVSTLDAGDSPAALWAGVTAAVRAEPPAAGALAWGDADAVAARCLRLLQA
ncbi:hypothetical protein [Spirilliplanes yamanashiensis]|uniref:Uncharacterized protein n=1 Tax=Spirilliplanes yamanashiensis TaxID=42233 RepID=A0A8J3Y3T8_9ACTN|nr:hypothetical protein [Spirilliplanes yamanashiensis]MDP9820005.1 hypothetical protein [Spirilliplanes yamanashiensis]GIJ01176.1 hypothetical protein Sya03_05280 [Spirilliplanes yamanashiensis]